MKIKLSDNLIRFLYKFIDVESSGESSIPNERMFEYSYALARVLGSGSNNRRVLEVGCVARINPIPATLCELGYEVYGIDGRKFLYTHKNFRFYNQDIRHTEFSNDYFDIVTMISTIEHIGLVGRYNITIADKNGDEKAIDEITRILKLNGKMILTVELGDPKKSTNLAKVYTYSGILDLLGKYFVTDTRFYGRQNNVLVEQKDMGNGLLCLEATLAKK